MKNKSLIFVFFLAFSVLFAEENILNTEDSSFENPEKIEESEQSKKIEKNTSKFPTVQFLSRPATYTLTGGLSLFNQYNWVPRGQIYDLSFDFDMNELEASIGINHYDTRENLTAFVRYAPTFWAHFNFGLETRFHLLINPDLFTEFDGLFLGFFRYNTLKHFQFTGRVGYMLKRSKIYAIEDTVSWLKNHCVAFDLDFRWKINNFVSTYFQFDTFTPYKYHLFCAPSFIGGFELTPKKNFSVGAELELCYIDFFTLSGYLSAIYERAFIKYRF